MSHLLDRPVWHALTTRQAAFATGGERAWRFVPAVNMFGASADASPESLAALAALVPQGGVLGTVEAVEAAPPPGIVVHKRAVLAQMTAIALKDAETQVDFEPLTEADASEMLALATLTEPGPFYPRTHTLGDFIGVKLGGRLVAMAGERMRVPGFTEASGVCTHPDFRGRGYAKALLRVVTARILARGETAFLHSYASNVGAIALYESLGYRIRSEVIFTVLCRN